jgi:hypothetical protein
MNAQQMLRNWAAWRFPNEVIPEDAEIVFEPEFICEAGWFTEHSYNVKIGRRQLRGPAVNAHDLNDLLLQIMEHGGD